MRKNWDYESNLYPFCFKGFQKLQKSVQIRIDEKLKIYSSQENPLRFAEKLKDTKIGDYRFRIGDYRVIFDIDNKKIIILKVGHRKDIYRDC